MGPFTPQGLAKKQDGKKEGIQISSFLPPCYIAGWGGGEVSSTTDKMLLNFFFFENWQMGSFTPSALAVSFFKRFASGAQLFCSQRNKSKLEIFQRTSKSVSMWRTT